MFKFSEDPLELSAASSVFLSKVMPVWMTVEGDGLMGGGTAIVTGQYCDTL